MYTHTHTHTHAHVALLHDPNWDAYYFAFQASGGGKWDKIQAAVYLCSSEEGASSGLPTLATHSYKGNWDL